MNTKTKKERIAMRMKYGKNFRAEHERLTKKGQTAMDYPTVRAYEKHLKKTGKAYSTVWVD